MISIEAWRCSIGRHVVDIGLHKFKENTQLNNGIKIGANYVRSSMGSGLRSAKLIAILLLIGCIESNPGPTHDGAQGRIHRP